MSSRRRLRVVGIASLIALLLSGLTMGAFAEDNESSGDISVQGEEEALQYDAEFYAEQFDVDVETAKRNLQLQEPAGELQAKLYENEADTYAGQWLDHGTSFKLIVWFTDGDGERLQQYAPSDSLSDVIEVREAEYSWAELREQQKEAAELVDNIGMEWAAEVNIRENRAEIWVTDQQKLKNALSETERQLPDAVEIIEVDNLGTEDKVPADVAGDEPQSEGSSTLMSQGGDIYGGLDLQPVCTTGFAVEHSSGVRGFLSAGHCRYGDPTYWSYGGYETPLQGEWDNYQLDVQWHTAPNHTLRNWVAVNRPYEVTREITGEVPLLQQSLGTWVCVYGAVTSDYRCGQIQAIDYNPGGNNSCYCYVHVSDPNGGDLRSDGDSGAPWYSGSDAYGVHKGPAGSPNDAVYMPTSTAAGQPELDVLTSCPSGGC